jgi:hypothetical protein
MTHQHIDELLADPIIQMVMKADHVEPQALKGLIARASARRPALALAFNPESVRFPGQTKPTLRLAPPSAYRGGETCLCC